MTKDHPLKEVEWMLAYIPIFGKVPCKGLSAQTLIMRIKAMEGRK